jgi:Reverse transcriptase (RNA-dependent DNA polymerase)
VNLSDHECLVSSFNRGFFMGANASTVKTSCNNSKQKSVRHLRWDKGDLGKYYEATRLSLEGILADIRFCTGLMYVKSCNYKNNDKMRYSKFSCDDITSLEIIDINSDVRMSLIKCIKTNYDLLVKALTHAANIAIPCVSKNFYKFWWDQEITLLKQTAIKSHTQWVLANKPKVGPIYDIRTKDKYSYKMALKNKEISESTAFTNDLQDSLLCKNNSNFWKCWNNKVNRVHTAKTVNGCNDDSVIANKFATYFANVCQPNSSINNDELKKLFNESHSSYVGECLGDSIPVDVGLVSNVIEQLQLGKGAGYDGLVIEHIKYAHPIIHTILSKLFRLMILTATVPDEFGIGLTIPLPKGDINSKSVTVEDYRGITISPVVSKIFEHCLLKKFGSYLRSSDHQFGFKKHVGCSNAIYAIRKTIDFFVSRGSTVNICSLDLSKAFDKINHYSLFSKLMTLNIPIKFIDTLQCWYSKVLTCVRWESSYSEFVKLSCGVRQGGVLSPFLFAVVVDDIIADVVGKKLGCHISSICCGIFLYADDIILLSVSVSEMQRMLDVCLNRLNSIDMLVNPNKSVCVRIGDRYDKACAVLATPAGPILWGSELKYLGVVIISGKKLRFNLTLNKSKFYRSLNAILGKLGGNCPPNVSLALIASHCTPCLLYGVSVMSLSKSELASIEHTYSRAFMKIFKTYDQHVVRACQFFSGYVNLEHQIDILKHNFLSSVTDGANSSISRQIHDVFLVGKQCYDLVAINRSYSIDIKDSKGVCRSKIWKHFEESIQ